MKTGWVSLDSCKAVIFAAAVCVGLTAAMPGGLRAQGTMQSAPADKTTPSYDMKGQAIVDLQQLQGKYVAPADAIPADKYSWRPAPDARSVGELFLHVTAANHNIPTMMTGTTAPGEFKKDGYEKSITDKAKIVDALKESFAAAIEDVQAMSNADFAKAEKKLGPDANDGDVIYILVTHAHEHLGQAIAYARSNGVVPPWTATAMKKDPKKAQD